MSEHEDGWHFIEAVDPYRDFPGVTCGYLQGGFVLVASATFDNMPEARVYPEDEVIFIAHIHMPTPPRYRPNEHLSPTITVDYRRRRADAFAAFVMSIVGKYMCDHERGVDKRKSAVRDLQATGYANGVEMVSDQDRAVIGMPSRGDTGLTDAEYQVMESRRLEIMMRPMAFVEDPAHPFPRPSTPPTSEQPSLPASIAMLNHLPTSEKD